jgi:hypothetical protein
VGATYHTSFRFLSNSPTALALPPSVLPIFPVLAALAAVNVLPMPSFHGVDGGVTTMFSLSGGVGGVKSYVVEPTPATCPCCIVCKLCMILRRN